MLAFTNAALTASRTFSDAATNKTINEALRAALNAALCEDPDPVPQMEQSQLEPCQRVPWSCRKFVAPTNNKRDRAYSLSKVKKFKRMEKQRCGWTSSDMDSECSDGE